MKTDITSGNSKGGVNLTSPKSPRPPAPVGQGINSMNARLLRKFFNQLLAKSANDK